MPITTVSYLHSVSLFSETKWKCILFPLSTQIQGFMVRSKSVTEKGKSLLHSNCVLVAVHLALFLQIL